MEDAIPSTTRSAPFQNFVALHEESLKIENQLLDELSQLAELSVFSISVQTLDSWCLLLKEEQGI